MFGRRSDRDESIRLRALDAINANVLITDESRNLAYMNAAAKALLLSIEGDIRKALPEFCVEGLVGQDIGLMLERPGQTHRIDEVHDKTRRWTARIGGLTFDIVETTLRDPHGRDAGSAIEMTDASVRLQNLDYAAQADSIGRVRGVVEFSMDGTVVSANDVFLTSMGYTLQEVRGRHHGMFFDPADRSSSGYEDFWSRLRRGEY